MLKVELVKTHPATGENTYVVPYFRSAALTITSSTDLDFEIAVMVGKIMENISKYMREGSGWTFGHIEQLEIHLDQFKPLKGSSYYIPTPSALAKKKAIVNVRNEDDRYF